MVANLVDTEAEELYIALTSKQSDNLLNEVQATSADFIKSNGGMTVTQTGRLGMLFGFNFIECEFGNSSSFNNTALTLDSNSYRRVPVWAKSGMALGTWQGLNISIDRLPQKRNSIQVYAGITVAASRTQEGKCLQILCSES